MTTYRSCADCIYHRLHCLHFHSAEIETPPKIPMPGDLKNLSPTTKSDDVASNPIFRSSCEMWTIFNDVLWKYYQKKNGGPSQWTSLEFAEDTYRRLLYWADSLPLELARGDQSSHGVIMMQ
jgi:hypothetical protein